MKSIFFITCLALLSTEYSPLETTEQKEVQLKVAAYNVEYSKQGTATEIGNALKPHDFDIVCFSEAPGGNWTKEVAEVLGLEHVVVGRYSTAGHKDKYKTIASRTPLHGYEEILMTDTLHTVTKATTIVEGQEVAIYSVHFPFGWRDQAHIDETTAKVTSFVEYLDQHQSADTVSLILGDFNFILSDARKKSPYYEMFTDIGLEATWKELDTDVASRSTLHKSEPEEGKVIDHILFESEKATVLAGEIIEMEHPLSDHKPVWALLQLK